MNVLGLVSDHCEWPPERFQTNLDAVRGHMQQEHPNVPADEWPTGFALPIMGESKIRASSVAEWGAKDDAFDESSDDERPSSFCV